MRATLVGGLALLGAVQGVPVIPTETVLQHLAWENEPHADRVKEERHPAAKGAKQSKPAAHHHAAEPVAPAHIVKAQAATLKPKAANSVSLAAHLEKHVQAESARARWTSLVQQAAGQPWKHTLAPKTSLSLAQFQEVHEEEERAQAHWTSLVQQAAGLPWKHTLKPKASVSLEQFAEHLDHTERRQQEWASTVSHAAALV
jgi:hypothetical protein